MKTTSQPIPLLGAEAIASVIRAAAENHIHPVKPESLLDVSMARHDKYLRSRLCSLVAYRLYSAHGQSIRRIAKAFRLEDATIRHRIEVGLKLSRKSPWKETYRSLP